MCFSEGERDRERSMALETVVYPQSQDPFGFGGVIKDFYNSSNFFSTSNNNWAYQEEKQDDEKGSITFLDNNQPEKNFPYGGDWNNNSSSSSMLLPQFNEQLQETSEPNNSNINLDASSSAIVQTRPKRRRAKSRKNKEEIENQRMTHIAVERNRRKQMNEYLSVLRSLMPDSYIQRGDQASIIGGAINFVKELEQRLQFLGAQKEADGKSEAASGSGSTSTNMPFSEFFTFPQYSTSASGCDNSAAAIGDCVSEVQSSIADIEVTMVESHANLKIRSKKRPKQLLKMVSGLQSLRFTILHLNVTTTGEVVLYSLSVKVEDDCKLGSVDDIAAAVYQMLERIQKEAMLN